MAPRKPKAPRAPKAAPAPTQSAASKKASAEADKAEQPHVYRADLGEALPPQAPHAQNTK